MMFKNYIKLYWEGGVLWGGGVEKRVGGGIVVVQIDPCHRKTYLQNVQSY